MDHLSEHDWALLRIARVDSEIYHRHGIEMKFYRQPLTFSVRQPLPFIKYDHLQDLGNKSIAIYKTDGFRGIKRLKNFIYKNWSRGNIHTTDIEFMEFFGKLVVVQGLHEEEHLEKRFDGILELHKALLERHRETEPIFKDLDETLMIGGDKIGGFGFTSSQWQHIKIRPLFRSLIMVIDQIVSDDPASQIVHLVQTGLPGFDGTTTHINFGSAGKSDGRFMTLDLEQAVEFVMELARAEAEMDPVKKDTTVLDFITSDFTSLPRRGYSGDIHEIRGPATEWIQTCSCRIKAFCP